MNHSFRRSWLQGEEKSHYIYFLDNKLQGKKCMLAILVSLICTGIHTYMCNIIYANSCSCVNSSVYICNKCVYCKVTVDRGHRFPGQIKLFPHREPPILLDTNTGCPWWTRCYYLASQPATEKKNLEGVELLAGLWALSTWNNATAKISVAKWGSLLQFKRLLFSFLLILSFFVIKICRGREGLGTVEQCDWLSKGLR